jgi:hypothetical protein
MHTHRPGCAVKAAQPADSRRQYVYTYIHTYTHTHTHTHIYIYIYCPRTPARMPRGHMAHPRTHTRARGARKTRAL